MILEAKDDTVSGQIRYLDELKIDAVTRAAHDHIQSIRQSKRSGSALFFGCISQRRPLHIVLFTASIM